ncbi:MAG: hypothetical protein OEV94_05635 [Deltaproteobacteria bacterium]|nr:hypothetical protein [Deltaproteobacteria bacterium]
MKTSIDEYAEIFGVHETEDFEMRVNRAAERAIAELDRLVADEVKLRFVTHVFARSIDHISDVLKGARTVN